MECSRYFRSRRQIYTEITHGIMKTQITIPKSRLHCNIKNVAFFGSADIDEKDPLYQEVFNAARHLAYEGKVVVNGGGPGVMNAATQGAESVGGGLLHVVGPGVEQRVEGEDGPLVQIYSVVIPFYSFKIFSPIF